MLLIPSDRYVVIGHQDKSSEYNSMMVLSRRHSLAQEKAVFAHGVVDQCDCSFSVLILVQIVYGESSELRLEIQGQLETFTAREICMSG